METHNLGPGGQQGCKHLVIIKEAFVNLGECSRWLGIHLGKERAQTLQPRGLQHRIGPGRAMAEDVDIERSCRVLPHGCDHLGGAGSADRPDADRTKPSGIGHSRRHCRRRDTSHWRLDNGGRNVETFKK